MASLTEANLHKPLLSLLTMLEIRPLKVDISCENLPFCVNKC